jgi:Tfp pilus assembly protein PilF
LLAQAESALEQAVSQRPSDFRLVKTLADFHSEAALHFDSRHAAAANQTWQRATELAPNHAILFSAWGRFRQRADDLDPAATLLRKAVDLDATDAQTWSALARLELQRQKPGSALVMYRQAVRHAPFWEEPRLGLASTYWTLGQPEVARRTVLEVLEFAPSSVEAAALLERFDSEGKEAPAASEDPDEKNEEG